MVSPRNPGAAAILSLKEQLGTSGGKRGD